MVLLGGPACCPYPWSGPELSEGAGGAMAVSAAHEPTLSGLGQPASVFSPPLHLCRDGIKWEPEPPVLKYVTGVLDLHRR